MKKFIPTLFLIAAVFSVSITAQTIAVRPEPTTIETPESGISDYFKSVFDYFGIMLPDSLRTNKRFRMALPPLPTPTPQP